MKGDKEMNTAKKSGKRLKDIRQDYNLTQEALAEKIGACTQTISYIETGKRQLSAKMAHAIISTLNIRSMDIDYLLGTQDVKNKELNGFQIWASEKNRELHFSELIEDYIKQLGYETLALVGVVKTGFDNTERYRFVMTLDELGEKLKSIKDDPRPEVHYILFNTPHGPIAIPQHAYDRLLVQLRKIIRFLVEEAFGIDLLYQTQKNSESERVNGMNDKTREDILSGGKRLFEKLNAGEKWEEINPAKNTMSP